MEKWDGKRQAARRASRPPDGFGGSAPQPRLRRGALRAAGALQKPGFWLAIPAAAW